MELSRRSFLGKTIVAGTGAVVMPTVISAKVFGANDRINIAVLGVNGRGQNHIAGFMGLDNVNVSILCDPDLNIAGVRAKEFEKKYGQKVDVVQDLRDVFDNKGIDAVSLATPNHWHALATIWACQAGKDVYVEKPGSHNIWEGRKMIEAAHKYGRIVQHGVQLRSSEAIREAVRLLHDGYIGRVYMARGLVLNWRPGIGDNGISNVPQGLDYDLWTGPAPKRPFSRNLVHYNWHWHWDYGNGDVGNQGVHETDLCLWGLGVGLPERITSMGGKFLWDDCKEVPEVLTSVYHYPKEGKIIQFEVRPWCSNTEDGVSVGNIFYGEKGYMVINRYDSYETYFGKERAPGKSRKAGGDHFKNFIDAVRLQDASVLNGPVESSHLSSALAHLGNIAYRKGRVLNFNPKAERFINDPEADKMLTRDYRTPFVVPDKV